MAGSKLPLITVTELHSKINFTDTCWLWNHWKDPEGYPLIYRHFKMWRGHRICYFMFVDEAPLDVLTNSKLFVCHTCDNPSCVNPKHLFLGSCLDNTKDKIIKNRHCFGTKNGRAKLTREIAIEIRNLYLKGLTQRELGLKFKISKSQIGNIVTNKQWII